MKEAEKKQKKKVFFPPRKQPSDEHTNNPMSGLSFWGELKTWIKEQLTTNNEHFT